MGPYFSTMYCTVGMTLLLAHRPSAEGIGVGDAAFILVGVEIELLELVDDRPDSLPARRSRSPATSTSTFIFLDELARELLPDSIVTLAV